MLRIRNRRLDSAVATQLQTWQDEVNLEPDYGRQVEFGKQQFKRRNTEGNATFRAVRKRLGEMCFGPTRCMYCEDSAACQVDHFRPKDYYPGAVFAWTNYLFACGQCNQKKSNRFPLVEPRTRRVVLISDPTSEPRGRPVLLNPRREDPTRSLMLDFATFRFAAVGGLTPEECERAERTIDILGLNRDVLVEARRGVHFGYLALLRMYRAVRDDSGTVGRLRTIRKAILRMPHPTVWAEMCRQSARHPDLADLFAAVPEALTWLPSASS